MHTQPDGYLKQGFQGMGERREIDTQAEHGDQVFVQGMQLSVHTFHHWCLQKHSDAVQAESFGRSKGHGRGARCACCRLPNSIGMADDSY